MALSGFVDRLGDHCLTEARQQLLLLLSLFNTVPLHSLKYNSQRFVHALESLGDNAHEMGGAQSNDLHDYSAALVNTGNKCVILPALPQEHKTRNVISIQVLTSTYNVHSKR